MLAALSLLALTFAVAFGSALLPLISVELFVIGLVSSHDGMHWAAIGAVVAVGQVAGKTLYYLAARGSIRLPAFLRRRAARERPPSARRDRWRARTKRLRGWVDGVRERCHRHPNWMFGAYSVSSLFGLPPFMAVTVLAGLVRMRMSVFFAAGLLGRFTRFAALAASPALFAGLYF